jgi:hypothetical protein
MPSIGTATAYVNGGQGFSAPAGFPPFEGPVGLVITPAAGPTRVTGLRIYTASGNPERDPVDYTLEGSINGGTNWTLVSSGPLNLPLARNASDATLDPVSSAMQEVLFPNDSAYSSYRVTFNSVRNPAVANSLQFAELELLGVPSAIVERPRLTITKGANNTIVIDTTMPGTLHSTTNLVNPTWDNEGAITPGWQDHHH